MRFLRSFCYISACALFAALLSSVAYAQNPTADLFSLSYWKLTLPSDEEVFRAMLDAAGKDADHYPAGYSEVGAIEDARTRLATDLIWGNSKLLLDTVPGEDGRYPVPVPGLEDFS